MVARLELSKDKANTEFSTNMMSEPPGVLSSAFEAAPCQDGAPSIEQVASGSACYPVQTHCGTIDRA